MASVSYSALFRLFMTKLDEKLAVSVPVAHAGWPCCVRRPVEVAMLAGAYVWVFAGEGMEVGVVWWWSEGDGPVQSVCLPFYEEAACVDWHTRGCREGAGRSFAVPRTGKHNWTHTQTACTSSPGLLS